MNFDVKELPENPRLKTLLQRRSRFVIESQVESLVNQIGDEICFRCKFAALLQLSKEPVIKDGKLALQPETKLSFVTVSNQATGKKYYPIFTDQKEFETWKAAKALDARTIEVTFDDLSPILKSAEGLDGAVVNPQSDNFVLERVVIEQWTERKKKVLDFVKSQMQKAK